MRQVLYVYGGPDFHPTEAAGSILAEILRADGRYALVMTTDLDAFCTLPDGAYDAVVVYTTGFEHDLTPAREQGLLRFVCNGGGFVGIHSATDSFRGSRAYVDMLNGEFLTHPHHHEFVVTITDHEHYLTTRMPDWTVYDEMYHLQNHDPSKVTLLASTRWLDKQVPMAYARDYGQGRVAYLANGHTLEAWNHPSSASCSCALWLGQPETASPSGRSIAVCWAMAHPSIWARATLAG
ncbi:MAG: ThuA domain-containing protein [Anaerolineae bacterium]